MPRPGDPVHHTAVYRYMADVAHEMAGTRARPHLDVVEEKVGHEGETSVRDGFAIVDRLMYWIDTLLSLQPVKAGALPLERTLGQVRAPV
jgi:hypothetical protein